MTEDKVLNRETRLYLCRDITKGQHKKGVVALQLSSVAEGEGEEASTYTELAIGWSLCHYRDKYRETTQDTSNPTSEDYLVGKRLDKYRTPLRSVSNFSEFLKACDVPTTVQAKFEELFTECAIKNLVHMMRGNSEIAQEFDTAPAEQDMVQILGDMTQVSYDGLTTGRLSCG